MCVDGLCKGTVPVTDDTVDLRLYQELCSLTGLQLEEERIKSQNSSARSDMFEPKWLKKQELRVGSRSSGSSTSMTCFLLDLSLEAHSTVPPRRSTVNSGLDWLLPNFWNRETRHSMRDNIWHTHDITGMSCCVCTRMKPDMQQRGKDLTLDSVNNTTVNKIVVKSSKNLSYVH